MRMMRAKSLLVFLCFVTFLAPIILYVGTLCIESNTFLNGVLIGEVSFLGSQEEVEERRALSEEWSDVVKEQPSDTYPDNSSRLDRTSFGSIKGLTIQTNQVDQVYTESLLEKAEENKSTSFSTVSDAIQQGACVFEQVIGRNTEIGYRENREKISQQLISTFLEKKVTEEENTSENEKNNTRKLHQHSSMGSNAQSVKIASVDPKVRQLKDQLVRAKVYLGTLATRTNPQYIRELRSRVRDIQKVLGDASKDSELSKGASEKLNAMELVLAKGKQLHDDCSDVVNKLRAIIKSKEDQLQAQQKQAVFLTQLAAKAIPKVLHCLHLRLSIEYFILNPESQQFPNQDKLENLDLHHYALFSDNVLAAGVVVNSTVLNAQNPEKHVFHVVTDRLNYAAMRMWFLANPPGKATIQVQSVEEFTWLNSSYSPVLKQLGSQSMIDYYFKANHAISDANLKFRNPKYLSILNHLRFYLPEIFPRLDKVVFLDDDIVVQKDLAGLWDVDLKGNVNGAVETCGEKFHRFDRYLNFSNPLVANNFDPHACGWAFGMNIFDLTMWRRQNITETYHSWQKLNEDRLLWKLGTLPPGLITFYKRVLPLDRSWHVLGLGYNPNVDSKEIELAAVVHYNGNMKPWLEIGMPKYRSYWSKYVDYDNFYLRECNITP